MGGFAVTAVIIAFALLKNPKYFAVEEQQIKNSVFSYVMMCLIFLIIAAFSGFLAVERIIGA